MSCLLFLLCLFFNVVVVLEIVVFIGFILDISNEFLFFLLVFFVFEVLVLFCWCLEDLIEENFCSSFCLFVLKW